MEKHRSTAAITVGCGCWIVLTNFLSVCKLLRQAVDRYFQQLSLNSRWWKVGGACASVLKSVQLWNVVNNTSIKFNYYININIIILLTFNNYLFPMVLIPKSKTSLHGCCSMIINKFKFKDNMSWIYVLYFDIFFFSPSSNSKYWNDLLLQ